MIRLLVLILFSLAAAAGAIWFADHPGRIGVDWLGYRAETSVATLMLLLLLVFLSGLLLTRLFIFLRRDLPFSAERRQRRRTMAGYRALNRALLSLAAGDSKSAGKLTAQAVRMLPDQPLTRLIAAEAARLGDDRATAREHYQALAGDKAAAFLGLRGLIEEARAGGETEEARRLAKEALAITPDSRWAAITLHGLDLSAADWTAALVSLEAVKRTGALDEAAIRKRRAALIYCKAIEADLAGDQEAMRAGLRQCLDLRPGFAPALLRLARLPAERRPGDFGKRLMQSWKAEPDPAVAGLILDEIEALAPKEKLRQAERFAALAPEHRESRLLLAMTAIDCGERARARAALTGLDPANDRRQLGCLATLARLDGDKGAADRLTALSTAAPAPHWTCSHCHAVRPLWTPLCPACDHFDSYQRGDAAAPPALAASDRRGGRPLIGQTQPSA